MTTKQQMMDAFGAISGQKWRVSRQQPNTYFWAHDGKVAALRNSKGRCPIVALAAFVTGAGEAMVDDDPWHAGIRIALDVHSNSVIDTFAEAADNNDHPLRAELEAALGVK